MFFSCNLARRKDKRSTIISQINKHISIDIIQAIIVDYYDIRYARDSPDMIIPDTFDTNDIVAKFSDNRIATSSKNIIKIWSIKNKLQCINVLFEKLLNFT